MANIINRITSAAMLAVAFMLCATSAWAVYSPGDTIEWSNTNTANTVSSTVYNECNFDFCIPATEDLPAGSVVRIKSIKLASLNESFQGFATGKNSDPYKLKLNGVVSGIINGAANQNAANILTSDNLIASNGSTNDRAALYTFSSECDVVVGMKYSAATGNNVGAVGDGIAFIHSNGDNKLVYGSSTDYGAVRYVQSGDTNSILTPYPSTSSTDGKGEGKAATDAGYYPVYVVRAEVVDMPDETTPDFIWDDVATSHGCSSPTLSIAKWVSSVPSCTTMRVGPNVTDWVYEEATPYWSSAPTAVSSDFSIALYGDVSQMPSSKRAVMLCLGKGASNTTLLIYREGSSIAAGYYRSGVLQGTAASIANVTTPGYRLIVCTVKRSTGELDLYVGDDSGVLQHGSGDAGAAQTIDSAWQIKNIHGGIGNYGYSSDIFSQGSNFVFAKLLGFERVLTEETVAEIFSDYPRTDGTKITADIDPALGGTLTVYTSATNGVDNCYLGGSYGTVTIPEGNTVTVPHMRFLNREYTTDSVTLNINGTVNVTSVSDTYNVYYGGDYLKYKGILFGHYQGTGTYNVSSTGSLIAPNAWLQLVYSAGQQNLNINGGIVRVKGIYSDRANSASVTLKDGGVLEVNEIITNGQDFTRNFKSGTFRITADATETRAINFSAVGGYYTTLDPYGHTLTLGSGSVTGSGAIKVNSSATGETKGNVIFNGLTTDYTGSITIVAGSKATLKAGAYTGTITVEDGATLEIDPGAGNTFACAASFAGAGDVIVKSGTASFSGTISLTKGIQVGDGAVVAATTGSEGKVSVLNGGTLKLIVASNNEIWYDGYVAADVTTTGTGVVEYYDVGGTKIVDGEYLDPNTSAATTGHFNGVNLLPYYYVWDPTRETSGSLALSNTDLWRAGIVPGDGTNVAIYVSGTKAIDVDVDKFFGEVQIYGTGSPLDNLTISGANKLTTPKLNVDVVTYITGQSIDVTDTIRNNTGMSMTGTFVCNATIVGSGDVYVGNLTTAAATATDVTFNKQNSGMSGSLYVMNKAVAKTVSGARPDEEGTGFGPYGGNITVCTGGQLDLANTSGVCYNITIGQGVASDTPVIVNSGDAMTGANRQTSSLTVNANATIECGSGHGWGLVGRERGATSLTIKKGVTLTKKGTGSFILCSTTVSNSGEGASPQLIIAEGTLETISAGKATNIVLADGASLDITISSGATFTGSKSLTASTFTVDGTANIGSSAKLTAASLVVNNTVNVASSGVITATTVSGAGTVNWTGKQPDGNKWNTCATWTGTNVVQNASSQTNMKPTNWGNGNSYIKMKGVSGYFCQENITVSAMTIFEDSSTTSALNVSNGYQGYSVTFDKISGDGTIEDGHNHETAWHMLIFKNADNFKGSIKKTQTSGCKKFVFSRGGTGTESATGNEGKLVVQSDGVAYIGDNKEWSPSYGIIVAGTVTLEGAGKMEKPVTISGSSARINLAGSALTINNTLTASDATWVIGGTLPGTPTKSTPVTLITGLTAEPALGTVTVDGLSAQHTVYAVEDSGTYNVVVRLIEDEWNSDSATTWTSTSFNGSSDYSDGRSVYFGAIEGVSAKTVTISGTVSPNNVTFRAGASTTYTLTGGTFSPSGTVAIDSGTVVIESAMSAGTFTVADGATLSLTNATVTSINSGVSPAVGTLNIPAGGVVTINSASALDGIASLTGEGTLRVVGVLPSNALKTLLQNAENWEGTFSLSGYTTKINNFSFNWWGNAKSIVRVDGINGYAGYQGAGGGTTYIAQVKELQIVGEGVEFNDAFASHTVYIDAPITGTGKIALKTKNSYDNAATGTKFVFTGNMNGYAGELDCSVDKDDGHSCSTVVFLGKSGNTADALPTATAYGQIIVTQNANVTLNNVWRTAGGVVVKGAVALGSEATIYGNISFDNGATLKLISSNKHLTTTSTITWPASGTVAIDISALPVETVRLPMITVSSAIANYGASTVTVVPPAGSPYGASRWMTYTEDDGDNTIYGVVVKPGTIFSVW